MIELIPAIDIIADLKNVSACHKGDYNTKRCITKLWK